MERFKDNIAELKKKSKEKEAADILIKSINNYFIKKKES